MKFGIVCLITERWVNDLERERVGEVEEDNMVIYLFFVNKFNYYYFIIIIITISIVQHKCDNCRNLRLSITNSKDSSLNMRVRNSIKKCLSKYGVRIPISHVNKRHEKPKLIAIGYRLMNRYFGATDADII